jgi:homoserine/homoserine lactone efflux protein
LLSEIFQVVRWAGALYLIWLGIRAWRVRGGEGTVIAPAERRSVRAVFLQGFLVAITNPKAIVFYIAFLPQFIDSHRAAAPQLLVMIGTMIVMALLSDSAYALLAARARGWFTAPERRRLQSRISGTLLIGVGCGLLLVRRSA